VKPGSHIMLFIRERRGAVVNHLLDRSFRHDKNLIDRLATRAVLSQVPAIDDDPVAASARRRGLLDSPTKRPARSRPPAGNTLPCEDPRDANEVGR